MLQHFIATNIADEKLADELFVDDGQAVSMVVGGTYCVPVSGRHFERIVSDLQGRQRKAFVVFHCHTKTPQDLAETAERHGNDWPRTIRLLSLRVDGDLPAEVEISDLPF
ncbi:MAG: hypothetical protein OXE96_04020 [Gemmatimonadetes bacterium]|nr:hypothetical protein [Gemmatimonadota bacterium]